MFCYYNLPAKKEEAAATVKADFCCTNLVTRDFFRTR